MQNEHEDDLQPSVDEHRDAETETFPLTDEDLDQAAIDDEGDDDELDDSAIVGK